MPSATRTPVPWFQYPCTFTSKNGLIEHWQKLLLHGEESIPPERIVSPSELDLVYAPGHGWRYVVSLASPSDSKDLAVLGDEFVRVQSAIFAREYREVDHKVWCEYLGLQGDVSARRKANEHVAKNLGKASRFNFQAMCHTGCTLKCEATPVREVRMVGKQSAAGSAAVAGTDGSKSPAGAAHSAVVGFVHFSMEESRAEGAQIRTSKRLKRMRGESTGEYIKVSHLHVVKSHWDAGLGTLMLTAMLHRVMHLEPSYAREIFLTVIARNERAVGLYRRLGLEVIGSNTTFVGKARGEPKRPVEWHQMLLRRPDAPPDDAEGGEPEAKRAISRRPSRMPPQ